MKRTSISAAVALVCAVVAVFFVVRFVNQSRTYRLIIERLQADSRIAEVLVTGVNYDEKTGVTRTTIKFLEFDSRGEPLSPRYFTFSGNILQFQSLVIRFQDYLVRRGHPLKGKSAYLFWKVFMLNGAATEEHEITPAHRIPEGYKLGTARNRFEERLWEKFWIYALGGAGTERMGIKNAQIEAPGTIFVPGVLYTIRIEHDGGMRIDSQHLPEILKGEQIPE